MNLNISWSAPSPIPSCGYKALYRRKADPSYTEIDTSGTTLTIPVTAVASFEGNIVSDCCSDSISSGTPFGVNGYLPLTVTATINSIQQQFVISLISAFANPYATLVAGTIHYTISSVPFTLDYNVTLLGGQTSGSTSVGVASGSAVLVSNVVSSIAPVFDNGGQLQQLDSINTPSYFKFYLSTNISGNTWDGSPLSLPSFTLDSFTATEINPDGITILAGLLNFSYILNTVPGSIYTTFALEIFDPVGSVLIGTVNLLVTPLGLRSSSIILTKSTSPLTTATQFIAKAVWPDLTIINTRVFYLP